MQGARSCPEFWLNRYQTLLGAIIALVAATVAVRPVWRQLTEMKRQSDHVQYEQMRARSLELNRERDLIYGVTASAANVETVLVAFFDSRKHFDTVPAQAIFSLRADEFHLLQQVANHFDGEVLKFGSQMGPQWGTEELQSKRQTSLEAAQQFSVRLSQYMSTLAIGGPVPIPALSTAVEDLSLIKQKLFNNALVVHEQINQERARLGRMISDRERTLFS